MAFKDACEGVGLTLHDLNVKARANEGVRKGFEGEEPAVGVLGILDSRVLGGGGHLELGHDLVGNERRETHLESNGKWVV